MQALRMILLLSGMFILGLAVGLTATPSVSSSEGVGPLILFGGLCTFVPVMVMLCDRWISKPVSDFAPGNEVYLN